MAKKKGTFNKEIEGEGKHLLGIPQWSHGPFLPMKSESSTTSVNT